jgi:FAD:protein FMN transferase
MYEYRRSFAAMATIFEIILRGDDEEHLEAVSVAVSEEIERLSFKLSRFDPTSEVSRINRLAHQGPVRIDRELFSLLEECEEAQLLTGGYFDVTGGGGLRLDPANCSVELLRPESAIDPGGVGKGYALDRGGELIRKYGITSALLQGGTSSILTIGDEDWLVAVRHPDAPDQVATSLSLRNRAFSCSVARHPGEATSDLCNPHTGQMVTTDEGCYVLAPLATSAEIWSTALIAMGHEASREMILPVELEIFWINE